MSNGGNERILVSRYVDGEMAGDEKLRFCRRLAEDPGLQELVREAEDLRAWFRRSSGQQSRFVPSSGFSASVLAAARRLPTRDELKAEEADARSYELQIVVSARRISQAAMVIFALSLLAFATLRVFHDATYLSAGPDRIQAEMERLDRIIMDRAAGVEPRDR